MNTEKTRLQSEPGTTITAPQSITGLLIGLGILITAVLFIGSYIWLSFQHTQQTIAVTPTRPTAAENNEPESTTAEAQVETLNIVSTSDELGAITADLEATRIQDTAADFAAIEAELNQ